ncbi:MAG: hypothetical protein P9L94_00515 [Candidatus Hinthialibacter antarcticus]|nr:hypothetical protein [Candidatus Hinthialibacter antarcticus]
MKFLSRDLCGYFIMVAALLAINSAAYADWRIMPDGKIHDDYQAPTCATCDYLHEQEARLRQGKKPIVDERFVPKDYWSKQQLATPTDVWQWPEEYTYINDNRTDSDGDGLLECRYTINFSDFSSVGGYSQSEINDFVGEFDRCVEMWNDLLEHVGLELKEVNDGSHHITVEANADSDIGSSVGLATLFGAWDSDSAICKFRSSYTRFLAARSYMDDTSEAFAVRPPGNPFVAVYPLSVFRGVDGNSTFSRSSLIATMLHEVGHLMGLRHPFDALNILENGEGSSYQINWLDWPTVGNPPPSAPSHIIANEDYLQTGWSRGLINTFMTYDDGDSYTVYLDMPPHVKAFVAHYYGIFDPASAQPLLDEAISEQLQFSPLARGEMALERENNDSPGDAQPLDVGRPVLGALSWHSPVTGDRQESLQDQEDWYAFNVNASDVGRTLVAELSIGSVFRQNFTSTFNGVTFVGDAEIHIIDPSGNETVSFDDEFPFETLETLEAGTYFIGVTGSSNDSRPTYKDYVLTVSYDDGLPSSDPTFTPTPSPTVFSVVGTPVPFQYEFDLAVENVYVIDGSGDFNSSAIDDIQARQNIKFVAKVRNIGKKDIPNYTIECWVNGDRFTTGQMPSALPPNSSQIWTSQDTNSLNNGIHTVEWRVIPGADDNSANDSITHTFAVGNAVLPTDTPTPAPPTNTPVPPTPTPVPPTNTPLVLPTSTPTIPASGGLQPLVEYNFDQATLAANGWSELPGGFTGAVAGQFAMTALSPQILPQSSDGLGLAIRVAPGDVGFMFSSQAVDGGGDPLLIRALMRADFPNASVAIGALRGGLTVAGSFDGSIALNFPTTAQQLVDGSTWMSIVYQPDQGTIINPILQVANSGAAGDPNVTVFVDKIEIYRLAKGSSSLADLLRTEP